MNVQHSEQGSGWQRPVLLSVAFLVVCAVVAAIALQGQLGTLAIHALDRSPPRAALSFVTTNGRVFHGGLTVRPNEAFVPFLSLHDDVDASPVGTMWLSPGAAGAAKPGTSRDRPIHPGVQVILDEPGVWHMHARVVDKSGNSATYSAIVSVFNAPDLSNDEQQAQHVPHASVRTINIDATGVTAGGDIQVATNMGAAAAIEHIQMRGDAVGVRAISVAIVVGGGNSDLAQLDESSVYLFPLDDLGRSIPPVGWKMIPANRTEYMPGSNIWRAYFEWEYDEPLSHVPAALRVSFATGTGEHRRHFFADTIGITASPDAIARLRAHLPASGGAPR